MYEDERKVLSEMVLNLIAEQDKLPIGERREERWMVIIHLGRALRVLDQIVISECGGVES